MQLTEDWGEELFSALSKAGGKAFSNMAVGYNNVDVNAANKYGVAVGNTPVSFLFHPYIIFTLTLLYLHFKCMWLVSLFFRKFQSYHVCLDEGFL